ncbi:isochorismatase family cysteine hydrolase [Streptacidiphilus sp. N1-10]|uniref:Isochorismatase family cysteine hydrolase n=1 Tax=Streptacidiphilus jeojiensis TaxID=3229225 RepID=A0ABV6XK43_9ACTN
MTMDDRTAPARTAFLALDFATYIVENFSHDADVAANAANALASARGAGLPVFHVVHEAMLGQLHPLLGPVGDEPVLGKSTMGAFASTDLDARLRAAGVERVVIAGVATSGTVLSTARWAYDTGYQVAVCADACADPDPRVHAALVEESAFPESWIGLWRIARVLDSTEVADLGE